MNLFKTKFISTIDSHRFSFLNSQVICCTLGSCNCDGFKPGKLKRRQCENCKHGWVAHGKGSRLTDIKPRITKTFKLHLHMDDRQETVQRKI